MTLNKTLWICFRLNSYYTWWWNRPSLTALLLKISHLSREQLLMLSGSDDETLARYLRLISPISLDVISSIINIQRDFRLCSTRYINPVSISSQREPNSVIIYDKYNIYNSFHFNKQVFKYTTVLPWDFLASGGTRITCISVSLYIFICVSHKNPWSHSLTKRKTTQTCIFFTICRAHLGSRFQQPLPPLADFLITDIFLSLHFFWHYN